MPMSTTGSSWLSLLHVEYKALCLSLGTGIVGYLLGSRLRQRNNTVHRDDDDDDDEQDLPYVSEGEEEEEEETERLKMVLLVRRDIKGAMKGKMMAQCAHASLLAYTNIAENSRGDSRSEKYSQHRTWLKRWLRLGCAKIALQCPTLDEAKRLRSEAKSLGIPTATVHDAGRTQVESGTLTVIALGPAPAELVDKVSGHLKLMR